MPNFNSMLSQMNQSNQLQNIIMSAFVNNFMKEMFQDVDPALRYANQIASAETAAMSAGSAVAVNHLKTMVPQVASTIGNINAKWNTEAKYEEYRGVKYDTGGNIVKDTDNPDDINFEIINNLNAMEVQKFIGDTFGTWDANAKKGTGLAAGMVPWQHPITKKWEEYHNPNIQAWAQFDADTAKSMAARALITTLRNQEHHTISSGFEDLIENDEDSNHLMYSQRQGELEGLVQQIFDVEQESLRIGTNPAETRKIQDKQDEMDLALQVLTKASHHDADDEMAGLQIDESQYDDLLFSLYKGEKPTDEEKQIMELLGTSNAVINNIEGQLKISLPEAAKAVDVLVSAKDFEGANAILDKFIVGNTDRMKAYTLTEQVRKKAIQDKISAYNGSLAPFNEHTRNFIGEVGGFTGAKFVDKDGHFFNIEFIDPDRDMAQTWAVATSDFTDAVTYFKSYGGFEKMGLGNHTMDVSEVLETRLQGYGQNLLDMFLMGKGGSPKETQTSGENWRQVRFDNQDWILHRDGDKPTDYDTKLSKVNVNSLSPSQVMQVMDNISLGTGLVGIDQISDSKNFAFLQRLKLGNPEGNANNDKATMLHTAFPTDDAGMAFKEHEILQKMGRMYMSVRDVYNGYGSSMRTENKAINAQNNANETVFDDEFTDQYTDDMKAHNIGNVKWAKDTNTKAWFETDWDGQTALNVSYNENGFINDGEGFNSAKATWYLLGHHAYNNDSTIRELSHKYNWTEDNKDAWASNVARHLNVDQSTKIKDLPFKDVIKAIGVAEGTLDSNSVVPSLEQLGGTQELLMAKVAAHPKANTVPGSGDKVEPPLKQLESQIADFGIGNVAQARQVRNIQASIDLLENEMGLPLSTRLNELDDLLTEKNDGFNNRTEDYWISEGRQEWRKAVADEERLAKKFYKEADKRGMVGFGEWAMVGSEVDEAQEMMTDLLKNGEESKYHNPHLVEILKDYNASHQKVLSITQPLKDLVHKVQPTPVYNPYDPGSRTSRPEDMNMFDNARYDEGDVRKMGFLYSGQSSTRKSGEVTERLAELTPEEQGRWTSRGSKVQDRILALSKEIENLDPMEDNSSFRKRLANANTALAKEKGELLGGLDGDEQEALALLELLTDEANLLALR